MFAAEDWCLRLVAERVGRHLRGHQLIQLVHVAHATAENHNIGVKDVDDMGKGSGEAVGISLDRAPGSAVTLTGQGYNLLRFQPGSVSTRFR